MILKVVIFCLGIVTSLTAAYMHKNFYFKGNSFYQKEALWLYETFKYWNYEILQCTLEIIFDYKKKSLLI